MTEVLNYEEAMAQLEEIMVQLDRGEESLDQSIELFGKGLHLVKLCNQYLLDGEKKISLLMDGELRDFSPSQGEV